MTTSVIPRLWHRHSGSGVNELVRQWTCHSKWSPQDVLQDFDASTRLSVKRSRSRFFMYEETEGAKLQDQQGLTEVLETSPLQFANLLEQQKQQHSDSDHYYHYWTSPVNGVAPNLLKDRLDGYQRLAQSSQIIDAAYLDPRGPSLWMGSSGSATQAHYDVADNVLVQLYGSKRIRCYPPSAATALYVFPDAHPRARKSQANLDDNISNNPDTQHRLFPMLRNLTPPVLDVTLHPGDVLEIPAFWFHHVENGILPPNNNDDDNNNNNHIRNNKNEIFIDGPSVSLNLFALSRPMLTAQDIFRTASRPIDVTPEQVVPALRALGYGLLEGLRYESSSSSSSSPGHDEIIRTSLLEARYGPLRRQEEENDDEKENLFNASWQQQQQLSSVQLKQIDDCIQRVLPMFESLMFSTDDNDADDDDGRNGIPLLVALHLMELWAVQWVGPAQVAHVWEAVVSSSGGGLID
jgi:hypothetical protein